MLFYTKLAFQIFVQYRDHYKNDKNMLVMYPFTNRLGCGK